MVRASAVIERVLNELKARQADFIEGLMIGAPSIANANRGDTLIAKRRQPLLERGEHRALDDGAEFSLAGMARVKFLLM